MSQNYNSNFTKGIKQWTDYDVQIELMNQNIKSLREKRDNLGSKLTTYIQNNELTKTAFNFNDSRVVFRNEAKYSGLSYDFLYKCSQNYFGDAKKAQQFCQFVKNKRQKTYNACLKRNNKTK
jgi:hypothetical protein